MWSQNGKRRRGVHHQPQEARRTVNIINLAAAWISRTPGNPNDGSLCTRRAAAEISISVWFAQIRTRGWGAWGAA